MTLKLVQLMWFGPSSTPRVAELQGKQVENRRPAAHLSEEVGAPEKELRTQLRDSYRIP